MTVGANNAHPKIITPAQAMDRITASSGCESIGTIPSAFWRILMGGAALRQEMHESLPASAASDYLPPLLPDPDPMPLPEVDPELLLPDPDASLDPIWPPDSISLSE